MKRIFHKHINTEYQKKLETHQHASFLQSRAWEEFQQNLGRKTWFLTLEDNNNLLAAALITKIELPFNKSQLYIPHGPLFFENTESLFNLFLKEMKKLAKEEKAIFVSFDPKITTKEKLAYIITHNQLTRREPRDTQPNETIILDISKPEEELLKSFHSKTRYNIRLAKRKGVEVSKTTDPNEIETFYSLMNTTKNRNNFGIHEKSYYKKQLESLTKHGIAELFISSYQSEPIAANIVIHYGNTTTYLHGASSNKHRNVMAPHLLQWEQILEAKKQGNTQYDFWGATKSKETSHPWHGVTRFKKGFSTNYIEYAGTYSIITKPLWYYLYNLKAGKK